MTRLSELGARARSAIDMDRLRAAAEQEFDRRRASRSDNGEPLSPWQQRAVYSQAIGSTTNAPSSPDDGVKTPIGRVFAEARSITVSAGTAPVEVTLTAGKAGVRAAVECAAGATITGGSVRFWVFDDVSRKWALGNVDETLPTGAQRVSTTDQFSPVGDE